jgi:hypothetical protein
MHERTGMHEPACMLAAAATAVAAGCWLLLAVAAAGCSSITNSARSQHQQPRSITTAVVSQQT